MTGANEDDDGLTDSPASPEVIELSFGKGAGSTLGRLTECWRPARFLSAGAELETPEVEIPEVMPDEAPPMPLDVAGTPWTGPEASAYPPVWAVGAWTAASTLSDHSAACKERVSYSFSILAFRSGTHRRVNVGGRHRAHVSGVASRVGEVCSAHGVLIRVQSRDADDDDLQATSVLVLSIYTSLACIVTGVLEDQVNDGAAPKQ